jgi:hypothetical protein
MSMEKPPQKTSTGRALVVVPLVLAVGVLAGIALSYVVPLPFGFGPFLPPPFAQFRNLIIVHMVLSTVIISLQVALVLVYLKVYAETGGRFALGILVVMSALLLQSLFQYPLLLGFVGRYDIDFGPYLSLADLFTIVAYTIFLYLSLD